VKVLLIFALLTTLPWLTGCSQEEDPVSVKLTTREKLIAKKWSLSSFAIQVDNGNTYRLTKGQWQAMGVTIDNLVFRTDGRFFSDDPSGTYTLNQDETVLELITYSSYNYTFTDLSVSDFIFSGKSSTVAVNPEKTAPTAGEHGVALFGLGGLSLFKEVDISKVKTVQLILTYNGI